MNLLDAFKQYIRDAMPGGALNPEVTTQGVLDAAALGTAPVPIVGDAIGLAADVRRLAKNPEERTPMNYGLTALGALPFLPSMMGGMIKEVKTLSKNGRIPDELTQKYVRGLNVLPPSDRYDAAGMVNGNMNLSVRPLTDGNFLSKFTPEWMAKNRAFYAVGDNVDELIDYGVARIERSTKSINSAEKTKFKNSLLGQLDAHGLNANDFHLANSERSASRYLTHIPTGTKIRISDHPLPMGYEQPDVNVGINQTVSEQLKQILDYFGKK